MNSVYNESFYIKKCFALDNSIPIFKKVVKVS